MVFRVRRNQEVRADIHAGAGTFLERDDGKPVEEVIQHLFTLDGGLLRDAVANLHRRIKNASVVADLSEAT